MCRKLCNVKKVVYSKKDGSVNVIASLIAILVLSFIFVYFISNIVPINKSTNAETIARKYMLKMEETGYLDADNLDHMTNDFKDIGIDNIDISGTTLNQVDYGDDVYLIIKYKITLKKLTVKNGIIPDFSNQDETVTIKKSSTSKNVLEP